MERILSEGHGALRIPREVPIYHKGVVSGKCKVSYSKEGGFKATDIRIPRKSLMGSMMALFKVIAARKGLEKIGYRFYLYVIADVLRLEDPAIVRIRAVEAIPEEVKKRG